MDFDENFKRLGEVLVKYYPNVKSEVSQISKTLLEIGKDISKYTEPYKDLANAIASDLPKFSFFHGETQNALINGEIANEENIKKALIEFSGKLNSIRLLDFLACSKKVSVFIGPNGSGKTTLLRKLQADTKNANVLFLQADRALLYYRNNGVPRDFSKFNKEYATNIRGAAQIDKEFQNQYILSQFNFAVARLENAHIEEMDRKISPRKSDLIISEWMKLVHDRELYFDAGLHVRKKDGEEYFLGDLSSGEKSILFFLITTILNENVDYLFIDEPENNLNPAIVSKLWNFIEEQKPNSNFIYLTHDKEFVESRIDSDIYWIQSFNGKEWKYSKINNNEVLPKSLLVELYGTRQPIIFCESQDETKLDINLYRILYPEHKIICCGGCDKVIAYVKEYKHLNTLNDAMGIIDKDYKSQSVLNSYKKKGIYHIPYHEVENILCIEPILKIMCSIAGKDFSLELPKIQNHIKRKFISNEEQWILRHMAFEMRDGPIYKGKINSLKTQDELKSQYMSNIYSEADINSLYLKYKKIFQDIVSKDSYDLFLRNIDFKKIMSEVSQIIFDNKMDYSNKVFTELRKPKNSRIITAILNLINNC